MKSYREMDHYELLEVSRDAGTEEIERAYALVSAAYEPDALASYSVLDAGESDDILRQVHAAYAVLIDPSARRFYDASLPPSGEVEVYDEEDLHFEPVSLAASEGPRSEPARSRPERRSRGGPA